MTQDIQVKLSEAVFKKEKTFHQPPGLKFKDQTIKVLHLEHSFVWCWKLETFEGRSEIP
jgi:hypothetical protein